MPMDNVTLENTQQSISSRDAKSVASVMVNGKWVNLSDTLEQANVKSDVGTVAKQVAAQQEVVSNAASTADSAVAYANDAVEKSLVNSQAIVAQSEAISEAKSAIDSATAEIQQAIANAASDAANIRAGVAQVQNEVDTAEAANSASVEALKSDVSATKQDLADVHDSLTKAQAAAEESQEAIDKSIAQINDSVAATNKDLEGVRNDLTKAQSDITANQKSINDNVSNINSDIEQDRKDIASVQQANADTAKQLDTYSKQAQDQGKTIKSIQDKQDGFTATLADVQGNVTQVSDKVDGLSASLKDAQDNVTSVKAQADQLSATLTDHAKSIATLTASAKELSSTLEEADGRLSKVEQTAQTNSSTLSDVQGDLSQVKQDATTLTSTLKDAQGNISTLQQKADGVSSQLASAQGDIASLQTDVKGIKATLVSHEGDIHTLQADSKTLKDDMQDAQGNISSLQKTATDVTSELQDHTGRISKVEQTASTLTNEFSDQDGRLSKVEQTATGTQQTVANQQGQINSIQTDVSGIHETITGQGNQITTINATLNGLDTKYEGVSGDLNNLKSQAQWVTVTDTVDLNNIKTPCHEFLKGAVTNAPNETAWWYLTVEGSEGDRITQTVIADQSNNRYTRRLADSWSAWVRDATQTDVTALSNSITTNSTQITQNKQAIDLKADQSTVDKLSGEVSQNTAQLKVQADQISSKVSSSDFNTLNDKVNGAISSIQKNSTAIDQTNKQISLKADQTEVDQVKQTATQNSSRLDVMDGKISSKVTSTDVNNIVDSKGFATTNTVQSLITQTAGTISESITKLEQTVKQGAENNVQLVRKSDFEDGDKGDWGAQTVVTTDPPAELGQSGMKVLQTNSRDAYEDDVWYSVKPGENFDVDFWCKPSTTCYSQLGLMFDDKDYNILAWTGIGTDQSGQWKHYTGTITAPANASFAKPWFQMGKDGSNTTDTALLAKPSIRRQNATTVAAIQQVTASIDGLQSNVTNLKNDTSSQITQLSNLIATKVSSGDYNSQISQLKDAINLRVTKGDVISQINQEAGGNTLIQVSNGKGSLALNAANTVITGKAWIPVAAIADLTADQIQAGTLKGVKVDFRDSTGTGMIADGSTLTFDVSNTPAGYLSYNGMPVAELPDGSGGNELAIRYGLSTAIIPADNSGAQATFSKAAQKIAYMTGTSQGKQMLSGLEVHSNNHHWLCAVNSDATCNRFEVNDRDGLNIAWHDNTHFFISDGNAKLYQDNNDSQTATKLEIHGWAWVNGWVEAAGHSQHSTLSSKTRIEEADPNHMLDLVNNTELTTFAFKSEVAEGTEARHIGPIIDDVNDVAQYRMPAEFIAPTKTARDDDNMIGALFGAVQALTKRIKALESKVG
ncbi:gp58-like family protein [Limosilactobacillus fermentum]|uniref:gp58-like family protein n=1 Tax=Limosilactobacillus fermentum TaxID=1613 RepID=UPI0033131AF2